MKRDVLVELYEIIDNMDVYDKSSEPLLSTLAHAIREIQSLRRQLVSDNSTFPKDNE